MQLNGQTLKVGQTVAAWIGSANRDSHYFNDADSFNIHRPRNPHLGFGYGINFCLGARLARLEATIVLTEIIKNINHFRLLTKICPFLSQIVVLYMD